MSIIEFIAKIQAEGVTLSIKETGILVAHGKTESVEKWLPKIRMMKSEILCEIIKTKIADTVRQGGKAWMWQITMNDRVLVVTTTPASSISEMQAQYQDATSIEPIE